MEEREREKVFLCEAMVSKLTSIDLRSGLVGNILS